MDAVDGGVVDRSDDGGAVAQTHDPDPVVGRIAGDLEDAAADERGDIPGRDSSILESFS